MVRKDYLENLVIDTVITELSKPKTLDRIVKGVLEEQERFIKEKSFLNVLLREKKQIETALDNMVAAIEQGVVTNTTTKRLKELEARQEELDRQIFLERAQTASRVSEADIRTYYRSALKLEAQTLMNYLVSEVVLYPEQSLGKRNLSRFRELLWVRLRQQRRNLCDAGRGSDLYPRARNGANLA